MEKTVEERNKWFANLTPSKQRVAVMRDVLKQIKAKQIVASMGTYFRSTEEWNMPEYPAGCTVERVIEKVRGEDGDCQVCAKGAVFCSLLNLGQHDELGVKMEDPMSRLNGTISSEEMVCFNQAMLDDIEVAFEGGDGLPKRLRYPAWAKRLQKFGSYYEELSRLRLEHIAKNVIANHGRFVPGWDDKVTK